MTTGSNPAPHGPRPEYERRLERWRSELAAHERLVARLGTARLALFAATLFGGLALLKTRPEWALWLLLPAMGFAGLVLWHGRARTRGDRARLAVAAHERALRRLDDAWSQDGPTGEAHPPAGHLFAADLDLFGQGSLFQLLATGRSSLGEATLARWLLQPAPHAEARSRQGAVAELAPDIDLFEALLLVDAESAGSQDVQDLRSWAAADPVPLAAWEPVLAWIGAGAAVLAGGAWALGLASLGPLGLVACAEALVGRLWARRHRLVCTGAREAQADLPVLSGVLALLEQHPARSDGVARLRATIEGPDGPPSAALDRLRRALATLQDTELHPLWAPVAFLLQRRVFLVHGLERTRRALAPRLPAWIQACGEFEALLCLATYAREHPHDSFPELLDEGPRLVGSALGHPLLPGDRGVRNDIDLGEGRRLLLVSGSNMSGKSTWLRTLGCNLVLARAGAPVVARRMALSELQVGTSIRLADSLQQGVSRFYAEVRRLRDIDELVARAPGTLVLLDEILAGTNSADRLRGAAAVVLSLVRRGALALVTTHDLALTAIVDELGAQGENVHFADDVIDDTMHFDHRLRPGVVDHGNALRLMRSLGLQV